MSAASSTSALSSALFRALLSSQTQNQMVEFARYAQLATIGLDGCPSVRSIHVRSIEEVTQADGQTRGALKFSTDIRSAKMQEFAASAAAAAASASKDSPASSSAGAVAELVWFFPVTREQFRLKCNVQCIVSEGESIPTHAPVAEAVAEAAAATPAAAASSSAAAVPSSLLRSSASDLALHSAFWRSHSQESRLLFELAPPGTPKRRVAAQGDLDRYAPQEVGDAPGRHFVTVLLLPFKADYLKLPRPAEDTRGQIQRVQHHQYESLAQPNRGQSRWMHTRDAKSGAWTAVELNP